MNLPAKSIGPDRATKPDTGSPERMLRLFVAIELPDCLREQMHAIQSRLQRANARVSWTKPNAMHLTLVFLGDTFEARMPACCRALASASASTAPFALTFDGIGAFGRPGQPRVIWIGVPVPPPALITLQQYLTHAFQAEGYPVENRPYHPHVTLGRVRASRNLADLNAMLDDAQQDSLNATLEVEHIALMQSKLTATGPTYLQRHRIRLQPQS